MPDTVNFHEELDDADFTETMDKACPAVGYQKVRVSVPVTIIPFAHTGTTKIKCCGHPIVTAEDPSCTGKKNGRCSFTISQTICEEIPVEFGATTTVGDTYVDCLTASAYDICEHCECEEELDV